MQDEPPYPPAPDDVLEVLPAGAPMAPVIFPPVEEPLEVLPAGPPHPGIGWAIPWCLFFLFVTQVVMGVVMVALVILAMLLTAPDKIAWLQRSPGELLRMDSSLSYQIMAGVLPGVQLSGIIFSLLVLRLVVGKSWKREVGLVRPRFSHVLLVLLGMPALLVVAESVANIINSLELPSIFDKATGTASGGVEKMLTGVMAHYPLWFAVLVIGLGPGLGEELWCRGFLGRGLVGRHGMIGGVLLTSLLFGIIHIEPAQALGAAFLGIILHIVYLVSRCLWLPMLIHFLNNSIAVVLLRLGDDPGTKSSVETVSQAVLHGSVQLSAIILLAAVGWAMYQSRARLVARPGQVPWQPAYPGVEHPPPGSGTVVECSWPGWTASGLVLLGVAYLVLSVYWAIR